MLYVLVKLKFIVGKKCGCMADEKNELKTDEEIGRSLRAERCAKEVNDVLEKHFCVLNPIITLSGSSPFPVTAVKIVALPMPKRADINKTPIIYPNGVPSDDPKRDS